MPLPFPWRYALREVRRRPGRSALTMLGIALSVAAVTAIATTIDATRDAYTGGFTTLAGRAALEVVGPGGQGTFRPDLPALEATPGVRVAVPVVQTAASLLTPGGPVPLFVLGTDAARDGAARDGPLVAGDDSGLRLERTFAARHGLAVGDTARLGTPRGPVALTVTGLLASGGPVRFNGGAVAILPLGRAQELYTAPGEVTEVQLVLEPGADPAEVSRAIERAGGLAVQAPGARGALASEFLAPTEQALATLAAIAVVCGALVSLNTLLMYLAERRRQLALLRALGATRRQVVGLLLRQGLLLGALGSLVGLAVGVGLAAILLRIHEWYLTIDLPPAALSPRAAVLAVLLGPVLAVLTALMPALRAARESPLAGISLRGGPGSGGAGRWLAWTGVALLLCVLSYLTALVRGWLSHGVANALLPAVAAAALVGCACLLPLILPALLRASGWLLGPVAGIEGRLAVRHLLRHQTRSALTAGLLFAALTVSISFGHALLNGVPDIERWYTSTVETGYLVRAVSPDPALVVASAALPEATADELRPLGAVARLRFVPARVNGTTAMLIARDIDPAAPLPMTVVDGGAESARAALAAGDALLGTALAMRLRVGVGDHVELQTRHGPRLVRVGATVKEYTVGGVALYLNYPLARELFGFAGPHAVVVTPVPGREAELGAKLEDYCRERGLVLQSNADFARLVHHVIQGSYVIVAGLVLLVFLVAALGVVNTLTTNVLDQTRELGVLRAVGLRRGQLRRMVAWQAVALAVASAVPGVPAGVVLAWLMNRTTPALQGHFIPFELYPGFIAACALGVMALAVVAALSPARRAARLAVIDALRYE